MAGWELGDMDWENSSWTAQVSVQAKSWEGCAGDNG